MPLYEYECTKCHRRAERIETFRGPHLKKCPNCGAKVERLQSAPAIQFKGGGWYVTEYAGKKSAPGDGAAPEKADKIEKTDKKESPKTPAPKETKEKKTGNA